jgi:hypothetical protein
MDNMIKQTNAVKQGAIKGTEATRIAEKHLRLQGLELVKV